MKAEEGKFGRDQDRVLSKYVTWPDLEFLGPILLKLYCTHESLGDLVKIQIFIQFKTYRSGGRLRFCIPNKFSGESDAVISHFK